MSLAGDRQACNSARAEIDAILNSGKLWYANWYFFLDNSVSFLSGVVLASILFKIYEGSLGWSALGYAAGGLVVMGFVWSFLMKRMFPGVVFGIGRSLRVGERAQI